MLLAAFLPARLPSVPCALPAAVLYYMLGLLSRGTGGYPPPDLILFWFAGARVSPRCYVSLHCLLLLCSAERLGNNTTCDCRTDRRHFEETRRGYLGEERDPTRPSRSCSSKVVKMTMIIPRRSYRCTVYKYWRDDARSRSQEGYHGSRKGQ